MHTFEEIERALDSQRQLIRDLQNASGFQKLDLTGAQLEVVNTVTRSTLYSVSVPAAALGANGMVRLTMMGDYLNDSGSNRQLTFEVDFGSTTLWVCHTANIGAQATRRPWRLDLLVANAAATNAQFAAGRVTMQPSGATATSGIGDIDAAPTVDGVFANSATEDTTVAKTLTVKVEHSSAATSISIRRKAVVAEILHG